MLSAAMQLHCTGAEMLPFAALKGKRCAQHDTRLAARVPGRYSAFGGTNG